jgi:hypothetical protein
MIMAKITDYKKLDDDEIVQMVDNNIRTSVGYYSSDLSREREKVLNYYNAKLPKPAHDGNSKYISQDVYNAVQSMQAALLETFAAGNRIVKFAPQGAEDVELAAVASSYTDHCLFAMNDGFNIFSQVIHDGLMARNGCTKVFWQSSTTTDYEEFENLTQDELDMFLASDDSIDLVDSETDTIGMVSGTVSIERDTSQVMIEVIEPENMVVEAQCKTLEDSQFVAHRSPKTLTELREMGFDEKKLNEIGDHSDIEMETDPEMLARHGDITSSHTNNAQGYQDQVRSVMVYEAYMMLDKDGEGTAKRYKIIKAGNALLDIEEVDRLPFVTFCPLPIPHAFYGSNFADRLCSTQNARTVLTRSILDHAVLTNNPRYMVVKGGLPSPRELSDSRIGGLVNVSRPDAISPLPQAPLNPFVFQTLSQLQDDSEENSGISSLTTGMNKDAVSKQNSAALVEQLATMSQQRQKIIARRFAQFVKAMFHEIYALVVENETQEKVIEIAGNYVEIDPASWKSKRDVMVELRLGYGEQEREAQKLLQMHTLFSQDPSIAPMYGMDNKYKMLKSILEQQGILNVEEFLTPPEQLPPPQPDPAMEMQMQMEAKQLELQERQTAVAELKAQTDAQVAAAKIETDRMKAEASHALQSDNMDLKESQFMHKQRIDEAELEVLQRNSTDVRGIASPTG